jgi:hypothetical protein
MGVERGCANSNTVCREKGFFSVAKSRLNRLIILTYQDCMTSLADRVAKCESLEVKGAVWAFAVCGERRDCSSTTPCRGLVLE